MIGMKFEKILLDTIIVSCGYCKNKNEIYYERGDWNPECIRIGCLCGDYWQNRENRTNFLPTEKAIDEWNTMQVSARC